jgi:hypothetical protein
VSAPIADLLAAFRRYLALDDADHVVFAVAVAVAAHFEGDPLWGLLVGPPSSGKTEVLRALDDVADEHLDEITVPGLLSWLQARKRSRPIGLLARHPGQVFATVGDFSTLLAMSDKGTRDLLFAILRRAFDGRVVRELGNVPEPLRWEGRLTLLAAVTPEVDRYSAHADALGPRWLYLRLNPSEQQVRRAASRLSRASGSTLREHRANVCSLASEIVRAAAADGHASVGEQLGESLDDAALVTCWGRAAVPRDGYGRREIIGMPIVEEPPRLAGQLDKLASAALRLGFDDEAAAALCRRAALDSMPLARRAVLDVLVREEPLSGREIARRAACDQFVARVTLADLAAIGVAEADEDEKGQRSDWRLSDEHAPLIRRTLTAARGVVSAKSRSQPPKPPNKENDHGHSTYFSHSAAARYENG